MLSLDVRINERQIAHIEAVNVGQLSYTSGDFIADGSWTCTYECVVETYDNGHLVERYMFHVIHDSKDGWQGLVSKIVGRIAPVRIVTCCSEDVK